MSLLQVRDMTRLETGKKIQILDSFTIFAHHLNCPFGKATSKKEEAFRFIFSSNYKSFKINSSAYEKMIQKISVSEATPCKLVNSAAAKA